MEVREFAGSRLCNPYLQGPNAGLARDQRAIPGAMAHYRCPTSDHIAGKMGDRHGSILGLARPRDRADSIRLQDGNEYHEAQRSDAEREEAQNFFHI
jgi:hypothetical protein